MPGNGKRAQSGEEFQNMRGKKVKEGENRRDRHDGGKRLESWIVVTEEMDESAEMERGRKTKGSFIACWLQFIMIPSSPILSPASLYIYLLLITGQ